MGYGDQYPGTGSGTGGAANDILPQVQFGSGANVNGSYSSSDSSRSVSAGITPRETAYSQLDQDMMQLFGRRATAKEKSTYYKQLHSAEKRYATVSKSGGGSRRTSDGTNTHDVSSSRSKSTNYLFDAQSFRYEYMVGLAGNYIQQGKAFGGQAGANYEQIKQYMSDMGLAVNDKSLIADTMGTILGKGDIETLKQGYRNRAISLYGGLADRLNANPQLTVRDAASDYISTMANMLDLDPSGIGLQDNTLQKALSAIKDNKPYTMTLNEFRNNVRQDNRFKYSNMAKEESKSLAHSLASALGFTNG